MDIQACRQQVAVVARQQGQRQGVFARLPQGFQPAGIGDQVIALLWRNRATCVWPLASTSSRASSTGALLSARSINQTRPSSDKRPTASKASLRPPRPASAPAPRWPRQSPPIPPAARWPWANGNASCHSSLCSSFRNSPRLCRHCQGDDAARPQRDRCADLPRTGLPPVAAPGAGGHRRARRPAPLHGLDKPILTDPAGFQVLLGALRKITEEGVEVLVADQRQQAVPRRRKSRCASSTRSIPTS